MPASFYIVFGTSNSKIIFFQSRLHFDMQWFGLVLLWCINLVPSQNVLLQRPANCTNSAKWASTEYKLYSLRASCSLLRSRKASWYSLFVFFPLFRLSCSMWLWDSWEPVAGMYVIPKSRAVWSADFDIRAKLAYKGRARSWFWQSVNISIFNAAF